MAAELFTGKNPLKAAAPNKPVELEPLGDASGPVEESIKARLEEMMIIDTKDRPPVHVLLPRWLELYRAVIRRQPSGQRTLVEREVPVSLGGDFAPQSAAGSSIDNDDFGIGILD